MRLSALGAADIRLHEGFVDHWYEDVGGVGTIGTGFTWLSSAFRTWWRQRRPGQTFGAGATMTHAEADDCLTALADAEYGAAIVRFLAGGVIPQTDFDAMVSVVFNCGAQALGWKWAAAVKAGDFDQAAALLKTTAITADGKIISGLISRRADEARLLEFGIYATAKKPTMPADNAMADGMLVRGERGPSVIELQQHLAALGFLPGKADGIFGFGTESAVLAFQRDRKLTADGKAGAKTLAALAA